MVPLVQESSHANHVVTLTSLSYSFQLGTAFQTAEKKIPKKKKRQVLGDIDILEIVEDACTKQGFEK